MRWYTLIWLLFLFKYSESTSYRLPESVSPTHYDLSIITHLDESSKPFTFTGEVKIKLICNEETKTITLHTKDLNILEKETTVTDIKSKDNIHVSQQSHNPENDFYTITLQKPLQPEKTYELILEYEGVLKVGLAGYYRSSYFDVESNRTRWLSVTQFESTDARRAFPCFDEPSYKAVFKIALGHHRMYNALSNMAVSKTSSMKNEDNWVWHEFEPTVPMSTYLVAFSINDFKNKMSSKKRSDKEFRIWARQGALNQVNFARDVGPKALTYFENYFNIKYPLPKVDMIAIPDFSSGAMENWGLITYREVYLLLDSAVSSVRSKHRVASVICHELAHQWFGNLVTMKWWTDLWLNEGFATFMATVCVGQLFPSWNTVNEEVVDNLLQVYALDSLKSSHPISIPIENTDQIPEIFDAISYKKGSYLVRMMSLFLGEEVLRRGVSKYLEKHSYHNADKDDLWKSLTEQAHEETALAKNLSVKTIMDTWTVQTGYPLITIERDCERQVMKITQQRYLNEAFEAGSDENDSCWWVPISFTTGDDQDFNFTQPRVWLPCPKITKTFPIENCDNWLIANIQAAGLYKVNYDEDNWDMIINALLSNNMKKISPINRVLLIENSLDLAKTGYIPYEIVFELLTYLKNEDEYLPWKTALSKLNFISVMLRRSSVYGSFKRYVQGLVSPIYKKLGGLNEEVVRSDKLVDLIYFRSLIADYACIYNASTCIPDAMNLFSQLKTNEVEKNPIPSDFQMTVYCTAVKHGDEGDWNYLWNRYKISNVGQEKTTILIALGCTRETWLLNRYLEWSLDSETGIRSQDALTVFSAVASTDVGFFVAKFFLETRLRDIYKSLGPSVQRMAQYISILANQMVTNYEQKHFTKLISDNMNYFGKARLGVEQAKETIRINVQWQRQYRNLLENIVFRE